MELVSYFLCLLDYYLCCTPWHRHGANRGTPHYCLTALETSGPFYESIR